ncbi:MAG: HEAT repeat domain-containing protein [Clostridia bacterium]|nr:HEAT repeat domain-containing protein [Deltaproteobacteria bacterium]
MRKILRNAALAVGLSALAACSSGEAGTQTYWLSKAKNPQERSEALRQIGKLGKANDPSVVKKVTEYFESEGEWQPDAAYALGELGDTSVTQTLVKQIDFSANSSSRLGRNKTSTNQSIARALGHLKAADGVDPLVRLASRSDDRTREVASRALGELGDKAATVPLMGFLSAETPAPLQRTAIAALGNLRDAKAVPRLVGLLYEERQNVSLYEDAKVALIQIGEPAVLALTETMERKNAAVEATKTSEGKALPDGAIESRSGAVLGAMRAKSAEAALIATLTKLYAKFKAIKDDSVGGAVVELAYALGYLGTTEAAKALRPLIDDPIQAIRVAGIESITASGDVSAVPSLLNAIRSGPGESRASALIAVTRLGSGAELDTVTEAVQDDEDLTRMFREEKVRLEAAAQCKTDGTCWRGKLADQNPRVRERAAYQLGWAGDKSGSTALLKSAEDSVPEVRFASVLSLERLGSVDAKSLRAIQTRSGDRMEYRQVNAEIARVLAAHHD